MLWVQCWFRLVPAGQMESYIPPQFLKVATGVSGVTLADTSRVADRRVSISAWSVPKYALGGVRCGFPRLVPTGPGG